MTTSRRSQVCLELTPYYHCISRCVRRSYLCGHDKQTKRNFNHRRSWIEQRLLLLSEVFCIELSGYAILSNHYHVILKVDKEGADALSDEEVLVRWLKLYKGTELAQRCQAGELLDDAEELQLKATVSDWRDQLSNISRFMGNLNEHIARKANKEDGCSGRFWEGRFKLQSILDLPALLQTLCYVDLNPLRAKMAKTPESSKYTSVRRRLRLEKDGLTPFKPKNRADRMNFKSEVIPISFSDYLELLDWSARVYKKHKRGVMDAATPGIIERLGYTQEQWKKAIKPRLSWKQKALGSVSRLRAYCDAIGQSWVWGVSGSTA